jgi:hypothetical protein
LKNAGLAEAPNFACPLSGIEHLRQEGIACGVTNRTQTPRRAINLASNNLAPLQNQIEKNSTQF